MSLRIGKYKKTSTGINVHKLGNIISINEEKQTVFVEPNVTMGQLTATLTPLSCTLPVLPELDDLTVGGLVCGCGVETSSHKFGMFQHMCVEFEVVGADGVVRRAGEKENAELFRAMPWSHGTLGFLVGVELKIVRAKKWVKVVYEPLKGKEEMVRRTVESFGETNTAESKRKNGAERFGEEDFVESLVYSREEAVLMTGTMVDAPGTDGKVNRIGLWYKPWFFTHVAQFLTKGKSIEYIPLRDYYHRHTKSLFWEMQDIVTFGNTFLFRLFFGWLMPPHVAILKRTQTEELRKLYELHHVVQDMLVPARSMAKALDVLHEEFEVYPLWVCPMRIFASDAGFIQPARDGEEMFVDLGVYGVPKSKKFSARACVTRVEEFVRSVEGFQMLYADMFQTREEFRQMFNHTLYDKIRRELGCETAFPEVYDKVCKANRH